MIVAATGGNEFGSPTSNTKKTNRTPMQVLPIYGDDSWPRLMGKLLYTFFGGQKPAVLCLQIESVHDQIPHDVLECWATCFWAANLCQLTANDHHNAGNLLHWFNKQADKVYLLTQLRPEELSADLVINVMDALNKRFSHRLGFCEEAVIEEHARRSQPARV